MSIKKHPFAVGFLGTLLLFVILNILIVQIRSDCGILGALDLRGCSDDISRAGFPLLVWESGGFAAREYFSKAALAGDLIIMMGLSALMGVMIKWSKQGFDS